MHRSQPSRSGFTLVEVLMVVAIIALAAGIIVPSMQSSGSLTVQGAARQAIADLLFAENDAMAQQKVRKVVFDVANNRYHLATESDAVLGVRWRSGGAGTGNYIIDFNNDERFRGVRIENADFGGDGTVAFDVLGSPDTGGSVDLVYRQFRYRISVAPMTGRVTIEPVTAPAAGG